MKRLVVLIFFLLSSCASVWAQSSSKGELFAGYSFESINTGISSTNAGTTTSLDNQFKLNGFNASAASYFRKHFGIAGDFSAHFDNRNDTLGAIATESKISLYTFAGGPQFKFESSRRLTPFVHALAGISRRNLTETSGGADFFTDHNTSFAMNLGGGVDYKLTGRFSWRLFQLDYNPIFLRSRTFDSTTLPGETLNGFRFSTGIVIK